MTDAGQWQIETVIEEWRAWGIELDARPQIKQQLTEGSSNSSYLLSDTRSNRYWVLRINQPNPLFPADRTLEHAIHRAASRAALAPQVLYQHPQGAYQLCEYIEGKTLQSAAAAADRLKTLCKQLHMLHGITLETFSDELPPYIYSSHIERYWQTLVKHGEQHHSSAGNSAEKHQQMLDYTHAYEQQYGAHRVICHHDLNPANIIATPQGFKLLDWEFAGAGIASMDFACLATELNIDIKEMSKLSALPQNELDCAQTIYQYTCELYNLAIVCINR